ncbi:MAG: cytochrome c biogenesis CcdA family protein [Jiangellaceae bacterium]
MTDSLVVALAAGMVAAFNPCGFALLPAYLTLLVRRTADGNPVGRALGATAAMTAGFVAVFGAFGLVVVPLALSLGTSLSWATVVVGAGLVLLGLWLLSGRELPVRLPRLGGAAPTGGPVSMAAYGVVYAVASLSCTIAPFLAVTTSTFRLQSTLAGIAVFLVYALGMGLVVGVLAVSVALAQDGVVRRLRGVMPYVNRISGVLLVVAGAYVTYYGVYEVRLASGRIADDPVVGAATAVQGTVSRFVSDVGPWAALAVLVVLVIIGLAVRRIRARRLSSGAST